MRQVLRIRLIRHGEHEGQHELLRPGVAAHRSAVFAGDEADALEAESVVFAVLLGAHGHAALQHGRYGERVAEDQHRAGWSSR